MLYNFVRLIKRKLELYSFLEIFEECICLKWLERHHCMVFRVNRFVPIQLQTPFMSIKLRSSLDLKRLCENFVFLCMRKLKLPDRTLSIATRFKLAYIGQTVIHCSQTCSEKSFNRSKYLNITLKI